GGHVVGGEAQLQAVAGRELVGRRRDRDFVVVEAARRERFRRAQLLQRLLARAAARERAQRGPQLSLGDDALRAIGGDVGDLGEPVGVRRRGGRNEVQRDGAVQRQRRRELGHAPREAL